MKRSVRISNQRRNGWRPGQVTVVVALAVALCACSAGTPAAPPAQPDRAAAPAADPDPASTPAAPDAAGDGLPTTTSSSDASGGAVAPGGFTPLSIPPARHPSGVEVRVTGMRVTTDNVVLDAEFSNGSRFGGVQIHLPEPFAARRLRLVDADGTEYPFVEPPGPRGLVLDRGETISGDEWVFSVPNAQDGVPAGLRLVTNVPTDSIDSFDLNIEGTGFLAAQTPGFVIPIS